MTAIVVVLPIGPQAFSMWGGPQNTSGVAWEGCLHPRRRRQWEALLSPLRGQGSQSQLVVRAKVWTLGAQAWLEEETSLSRGACFHDKIVGLRVRKPRLTSVCQLPASSVVQKKKRGIHVFD